MPEETSESIIFPNLIGRDRKLCEKVIRQLQSHSVVADFGTDGDAEAAELYAWAERNIALIEAYFRFTGLSVRAHGSFPMIQLVLEDEARTHPLRRRLDKAQTGLLICLWVLYHQKINEVDGFIVPVSIKDVYDCLTALFRTSEVLTQTPLTDVIRLFDRYRLVKAELLHDDFLQSRLLLLPTLVTTFRFQDAAEARQWIGASEDDTHPEAGMA